MSHECMIIMYVFVFIHVLNIPCNTGSTCWHFYHATDESIGFGPILPIIKPPSLFHTFVINIRTILIDMIENHNK